MSKFEQQKIGPQEKEIKKQVRKIKEIIEGEGKTAAKKVEFRLEKAEEELNRAGIETTQQELLRQVLKLLREDWGGLPEELNKEFLELEEKRVADKIAKEWTSGDGSELHQLLRKYVVEAKRQGIELDGKEIERRVRGLFTTKQKKQSKDLIIKAW